LRAGAAAARLHPSRLTALHDSLIRILPMGCSCEEHLAVVRLVLRATKEVRNSAALRSVIQFTLALGNYMNGTSNKGGAWGFKLDALSKLTNTKTTDNKKTLLHYMAEQLAPSQMVKKLKDELATLPQLRFEWKAEQNEIRALTASIKVVTNAVANDTVQAFVQNMGTFADAGKAQLDQLTSELDAADMACKELGDYLVEDSLKDEPEKFLAMLQAFVVSFEKADRFNQESVRLEAQKKKREEAASKREAERKAKGPSDGKDNASDAQFKMELNKALLQKAGIRNDRKNLIDSVESGMTNAGQLRARRHAPASAKLSR